MKHQFYTLCFAVMLLCLYCYVYITALRHDVVTLRNKCEELQMRVAGVELEFINESLPEAKYDMWDGGDTTANNMILESP